MAPKAATKARAPASRGAKEAAEAPSSSANGKPAPASNGGGPGGKTATKRARSRSVEREGSTAPKPGKKAAEEPAEEQAAAAPVSAGRKKRASTVEPQESNAARANARAAADADPGARGRKRTRVGGTPGPGGSRPIAAVARDAPAYIPRLGMNPLPAPIQPIRLADLQAGLAGDVTSHSTSEASAPASVNGATKNGPVLPRQMFVFGNGDMGQHGLGTDVIDEIKRPRLHAWVASKNAEEKLGAGGLEMIAAGGMHTLAIDSTGKILSWGINDNAALGRRTTRDPAIEAEVFETEPMPVEGISPSGYGILGGPAPAGGKEGEVDKFRATRIAAGDSVSVALSEEGDIRVWGSFRSNDGLLGFDGRVGSERTQFLPVALPALQKNSFSQVTCGDDHVLALTTDGYVYSWGNGQQSQLGRRIIERRKINGLTPEKLAVKHIVLVGSGAYHSFAVDKKGQVFGWGLNSMGQTGAENNDDIIPVPAKVDALDPRKHGGARVVQISAGAHHSLFLLSNGQVYACGRCDGFELGLADDHPAMMEVSEERGRWETRRREALLKETAEWQIRMAEKKARMQAEGANMNAGSMDMVVSEEDMPPKMGPPPDEFVSTPVHVPFPDPPASAPAGAKTKDGKTRIVALASGTRHNLAVAADGTLYSWGFGISSQLGQGDEESVKVPTVVKSKQFLGHKAVGATAGGQHSVVLAIKDPEAAI